MGFLTKRAFISLYFEEVGVCTNLLLVRAKREEVLLSGVLQDFEIQRLLVAYQQASIHQEFDLVLELEWRKEMG